MLLRRLMDARIKSGMTGSPFSNSQDKIRPSYSAKAEYPVRCGFSIAPLTSRNTGSPAFAGDDGSGSWNRHCERKRSNLSCRKESMDCFVAYAPRNDVDM